MNRVTAVLPAAGLGTRMGADTPKQFLALDSVPLLLFTLRRLAACPLITDFVIATRAEEIDSVAKSAEAEKFAQPVSVVRGGDTRQDSVANALAEVSPESEFILVHDAVRPLVTLSQIERVIAEAEACDAAILGIPAMDTVKEVKRASLPTDVALVTATIPRERV
ncbi:MAG TPA: 2-C-methyl-D-erythritol 4-phosphate cytidylyltransferase, partial [Verrucomicrobiae bacterium]|nr:2-C-methyl-D-erythritol 4-phosphate cytidylyltransferase [Verrucomicrobiae bacterium]